MQEQLWPNLWYNIICIVWLKKMENLSQEPPSQTFNLVTLKYESEALPLQLHQ
jgi:hypothetical protein